MVKGLCLTRRDKELLYDCYHSGCLTFQQVKNRHFEKNAANTAYNRIQGLKRAGYLTSLRVGILLHHAKAKEVGVVYRPTRKALLELSRSYPKETFRERPLRINTATLHHDLLLVDVMTALKERFEGERIVRASLYGGPTLDAKRTPDAIVLDQAGRPCSAIELELTMKSKARYREIVVQYRLAQAFKKVIYVTANESIAERIREQITPHKRLPGLPAPCTDRFYFVTVAELLESPRFAAVTNGRDAIGVAASENFSMGGGKWE